MNKYIVVGVALFFIIAASLILFYDRLSTPEGLALVSVAYLEEDMLSNVILEVAEREGFLKEHGLAIKRVPVSIGLNKTLLTGQVDVVIAPSMAFWLFLDGADIKWIGNLTGGNIHYLVSRYDENNLQDIKVAGGRIFPSHDELRLRLGMKALGADLSGVEFAEVGGSDLLKIELLKRGDLDIISVWSRTLAEELIDEGFYLMDVEKVFGGVVPATHLFVLNEKIESQRESFKKIIAAFYQASRFIQEENNERTALWIIGELFGFDKDRAVDFYNEYKPMLAKADYVPDKNIILPLIPTLIEMREPQNSNRNLDELVYPFLAEEAIDLLGWQ